MNNQESIRASLDDESVQGIPHAVLAHQFFDSGTQQIIDELVQNARRSGATRIEAWTDSQNFIVNDDGCGIADPQVVLAFGKHAWNKEIARIEHPAGIGLCSVARLKTRIESLPAESPDNPKPAAWAINLDLAAFTGHRKVAVETTSDAPRPHGTKVVIRCQDTQDFERALRQAALHGPLTIYLNGKRLLHRRFLGQAIYVREWNGLRIGVFLYKGNGLYDWELNFHGREVNDLELPQVRLMTGWWHVKIEAISCPELELSLPTRRSVVPTPFLETLREEARRTIFLSMEDTEGLNVSAKIQQEAHKEKINLPTPEPRLSPWRTHRQETGSESVGEGATGPQALPKDAVVMAAPIERATAWMIERATRGTALGRRLYEPNPSYESYPWYDELSTITRVTTEVQVNDNVTRLNNLNNGKERPRNSRPDSITIKLLVQTSDGKEQTVQVQTDVAFDHDDWFGGSLNDVSVLVTRNSTITEEKLVELMTDALHHVREGDQNDCRRQKETFQEAAEAMARDLLLEPEESMKKGIEKAVSRHVYRLAPMDGQVNIVFTRQQPDKEPRIHVAVQEATATSNRRTGPSAPPTPQNPGSQ